MKSKQRHSGGSYRRLKTQRPVKTGRKRGKSMEQLSKIGFYEAHRKYRDVEMFKVLCAYQDTGLEPEEIPQWIPVSEKLPEESDGDKNGEILIRKDGEDWITKVPWVKEEGATYWERLPQPPKGEKP